MSKEKKEKESLKKKELCLKFSIPVPSLKTVLLAVGVIAVGLIVAYFVTHPFAPRYSEIANHFEDDVIVKTDWAVSTNGTFSLVFNDKVSGGSPTLTSLCSTLGIENNDLSLNGSLNYNMSTVYSEKAGYCKSDYKYMLFSNCTPLNDYLCTILPDDNTDTFERYYDFETGDTYTVSENALVKENGEGKINAIQNSSQMLSIFNFVYDSVGDKATTVKKWQDGYVVTIKFDVDGDFVRGISGDIQLAAVAAGYNLESIAEILDTTRENYGLTVPVTMKAYFSENKGKYRLEKYDFSGQVLLSKEIPYEDIKQAYGLTDAENFTANLDINLKAGLTLDFGYDPVTVNLPK